MANRYWVGGNATWDATAGTKWSATSGGAGGASVPTAADIALFDAASGASTVTIGSGTAICLQLNMVGFTGTLAFGSNSIELPGSGVAIYVGSTTFSVTGTPVINCTYSGGVGTRTIACAAVTEANTISFNITAGTDTVNIQNNCKNLNFTGFSGTLSNANTRTIFGNLTISTGMSLAAGAVSMVFGATSGTQQVTSNGKTFDFPLNQNGAGGTVQLQDNLTVGSTRTYTLTNGTLNLNNLILTTGLFASSNSNVRSIAFGTGNITLTGNAATIWSTGGATNLSVTGNPVINANYSGPTGTRTVAMGNLEAISINVNVSAGSDTFALANGGTVRDLNFTGFTGTWSNIGANIFGDLTISSGMTVGAGANNVNFITTGGSKTITSNGKTLDFPITLNSVNGAYSLQDNFTMGSTRQFTHTAGTLNLNNLTFSCGLFTSTNSNIRVITFGSGNITTTGSGTVWSMTTTNFSYTGTPTVNIANNSATATTVITGSPTESQALNFNYTTGTYTLTDSSAVYRSLNFTGFNGTIGNPTRVIYGSLTLSSGMTLSAGTNETTFASTTAGNTITSAGKTQDYPITFNGVGGVWTCQDALTLGSTRALTFTNGTLNLRAGTTSTVGSFVTTGSNQKYLGSSTPGTQATISDASGINSVSFLSIQDSVATGGADWEAYASNGNIDAGNNLNWDFGATPILGTEYEYKLRSFTQPRRF